MQSIISLTLSCKKGNIKYGIVTTRNHKIRRGKIGKSRNFVPFLGELGTTLNHALLFTGYPSTILSIMKNISDI